MSLHEDLMEDAFDVLLDVQGTPALVLAFFAELPASEALRIDGVRGATSVDWRERTRGGLSDRVQVETVTVKTPARSTRGTIWRPEMSMQVQLGDDPERWTVERLGGLGTGTYELSLQRPYLVNRQGAGRERR